MTWSVHWSSLAVHDLDVLITYLEKNWGASTAGSFIDLLEETVDILQVFPEQFPLINNEYGIRKCVLTKHNVIYYKLINNRIEILRLYDTRQDPQSLKFSDQM